jgi:hypothetical protein
MASLGRHMHKPLETCIDCVLLFALYWQIYSERETSQHKTDCEFKLKDVTFFKKSKTGTLVLLPRMAPASVVMSADSATLKLDNQKNGWKGICVHQEANGESFNCPVRALARRVLHLRKKNANRKTFLSAFFSEGACYDVCGKDVSKALMMAAAILQYPITRGISIKRIDTHSLWSGGANALALFGYWDTQIQKMGRWKGAIFKEYI